MKIPFLNATASIFLCLCAHSWCQISWRPSSGPFSGYIGDIAGARNGKIFAAARTDGLYRSSDHGATWQLLQKDIEREYAETLVSTLSGVLFLGTDGKVFRSQDDGQSWIPVFSGVDLTRDLWSFSRDRVETIYLSSHSGFWYSPDLGHTWKWLDDLANAGYVYAMLQAQDGSLWAGTEKGLLRQPAQDTTWVESAQGLPEVVVTALLELPNHTLLAGTNGEGVYELVSGNTAWQPAGLEGVRVNALALQDNGRIVAMQNNLPRFYSSEDNGLNWLMLDSLGLEAQSFYMSASGERFVGTSTVSLLYSKDPGKWKQIGPPISRNIDVLDVNVTGTVMAGSTGILFRNSGNEEGWLPRAWLSNHLWDVIHTSQGTLLALVLTGAVLRSKDDGQSWQYVGRIPEIGLIAFATNSKNEIFIATNGRGVFWSSDEGEIWHQVMPDFLRRKNIVDLSVNNQEHLFAVTYEGETFRSTTQGRSWEFLSTVPAPLGASSLGVDSHNRLFVTNWTQGVFRSDTSGVEWQQINNGLDSTVAHAVAINSNDDVFVATATGVYASTDHGDHWRLLDHGIPADGAYRLALDANERLYAGTYEHGVFHTANSTLGVAGREEAVPAVFDLEQNYPNPFNPVTRIRFALAKPGRVELAVYDLLGEKVAGLLDQRLNAGVHEVEWNARNEMGVELASGVYLYRLKSENEELVRKMLLLR